MSGDHIMIAAPFVIGESEIDWFVDALEKSIERVYQDIAGTHEIGEARYDCGSTEVSSTRF